ncbi:hypothetical protein LCGC14_0781590 [marine sediment metagenome]|uniref:Uncharacterized protein n=1 Tax=marine sediment metagenome TaxID=412755 RepID=A0A0F9QF84_9ZZZZ
MTDSKERSIYISSAAMTKLNAEKASAEQERMSAKAKIEEEKLQDRRARQEQQLAIRANKKAEYVQAKESDKEISRLCEDLTEAMNLSKDAQGRIQSAQNTLSNKAAELTQARQKLETIKRAVERLVNSHEDANLELKKVTTTADPSIIALKKSRLETAYTQSNKAWGNIQKAIRKRDRDRSVKKWAKNLLDL